MKKISIWVCLSLLLVMLCTAFAFGDGLEIVESYPDDGRKNMSVENLGIKLTFNNAVNSEENKAADPGKYFSITDTEDPSNPLEIKVYYNPKAPEEVLVLYSGEAYLQSKTVKEYKVWISGDFADVDGNTLGADRTISFTTINQKLNTTVYFVMMIVMFGGMFFFSSRQAKKQTADDTEVRDEPFNPYKEAKRTGKSLEEVIAQHEKETARREAKAAKRAPKEPEPEPEDDWQEDWDVDGLYKVKRRRPISEGGGKYITGRKAIAEARKAEEERLARRRAARK
ncbi:MAG: Ig-like domain-containing protein, partial [Firmicutes bacterium]|nr:Ig-like domain-containing protein [Bacillota bacterium]